MFLQHCQMPPLHIDKLHCTKLKTLFVVSLIMKTTYRLENSSLQCGDEWNHETSIHIINNYCVH